MMISQYSLKPQLTPWLGIFLAILTLPDLALAQKPKVKALIEERNTRVSQCITQNMAEDPLLAEDFKIYEWAKKLQKYCEKVVDDHASGVLTEIADQAPYVDALLVLTKKCKALDDLKKHLERLSRQYAKRIDSKSSSQTNPQLDYRESRIVKVTVHDVRVMKVQVNSIVNIIEGNKSLLKIFR